jgi:medium-chain acyl-[acyl-carrier-protein] hydrolase
MQLLLPMLRADFAACETYRYCADAPLDVPIVVFSGQADPKVNADECAAWQSCTTGACRQVEFAGDHFFIHTQEAEVLAALRAELLG